MRRMIVMGAVMVAGLAPSLPAQALRAPSCTEDNRSACWIQVTNQRNCQFWHDDRSPSLEAAWSGECSDGLAEGGGTLTWDVCFWDNGACMPVAIEQSGRFLNGRRQGRWIEGPADAAACHRWNTDMYFKAATVESVSACLDAGADVNANAPGYLGGTPLHHAVRKNELPIIEVLLNAGADVDARDTAGDTPLHEARSADPTIVRTLLAAGADVNALNRDLDTPLHEWARFNSDQSVVLAQILIDAGADVKARQRHDDTALHFAARRDALPVIEVLLEAGADVDARNYYGETPLHEAASVYPNLAAIEALIAAGADPQARNAAGETPLHRARNPAVIEVLLATGADVDARDNEGETPLHEAAGSGVANQAVMIEALLAAGADLEARDEDGNTPLHSVLESDVDVVLTELPAELEPRAVGWIMESVDFLIKAGANLEARNGEGNTPLHLAANYIYGANGVPYGYSRAASKFNPFGSHWTEGLHAGDAIRALLAAGADPRVRNGEGQTPCDLYRRNIFLRAEELELCQ